MCQNRGFTARTIQCDSVWLSLDIYAHLGPCCNVFFWWLDDSHDIGASRPGLVVENEIFEKLNLSIDKAEKDIGVYKSSITKMEQAKELIQELKIKDKK